MHQNLRPYQRWSGVGGDQAPALLGNLSVRLQFHIIQQIMGASLLEDLFHVFENDDEDIFVPAGLRAPHDWVLCLSAPPPLFLVLHVQTIILYYTFCRFLSALALAKPSVHKIFCISHFGCFYPRPSLSSPSSCKTIRSRNILYFTFCLFFHTFDPPSILSSQSHLQSHAKRNPEPTPPTISVTKFYFTL